MHIKLLLKPRYTLRWPYGTFTVLAMQFTAIATTLHVTCLGKTTQNTPVTSFTMAACLSAPAEQADEMIILCEHGGLELCPLRMNCTTTVVMTVAYASSGYA